MNKGLPRFFLLGTACMLCMATSLTVHAEYEQKYIPRHVIRQCAQFKKLFSNVGKKRNIPPGFLVAISVAESECVPTVITPIESNTGEYAEGMLQLLPSTFADLNMNGDLLEADVNIEAAGKHIEKLSIRFDTPETIALAYFCGARGALRYLRKKDAREHYYVRRVMGYYKYLGH